ncbi:MAG: HAMP domain-containing histidine kinase [Ardenticatenaceae bacterium]|nr:HAMP domain-containing histidine kinase [Ardenticatenaceae bacterium]MCB9443041.1 HAMP domain-containing histidine kinase [Ardenticatenaceae bacterium]
MLEKKETKYAPAERATFETLQRQRANFSSAGFMLEIMDSVPSGLVVLNEQRQIVYSNDAFCQAVKTKESSAIGLRPGEALNCIHAFETDGGCGTTEFCSTCGAVQAILQAQKGNKNIQECRIMRHDVEGAEEALDLRVWATPMQLNGERFTIFAVNDISNEKRRRVLERVFFHDIRNTAGAIQGLAELIAMVDDPAELQDFDFGGLLDQASHQLIDEIEAQRQIMAAENEELEPELRRIQALLLLQDVKKLYDRHIISEERFIQLDPQSENLEMLTDPTLLKRVVGNMVKNALEACKPDETVTIGCDRFGGFVRFWVHNPTFMPNHIQLQIFQRSFSTKGNGRGLGTYSMKLLSERYLNGRVTFKSSPNEGTVFIGLYPARMD